MTAIEVIWNVIQFAIGYNLIFPFVLYIIWLIFKRGGKAGLRAEKDEPDYAIIVTAYEQTESIPAVVNSIINLNYSNFLVYIVADKCDVSSLSFSDQRVVILRPPNTIASNTGSHFYAIDHFRRNHELLTIIDSDNLVHPEYLNELNLFFSEGFEAVQGIRKAKNLNTTYACLDAARDTYYHFYDGRILFNLGSSATLSGSGMAFTTSLYKDCLEKLVIRGAGFDKVLQNEIVKRGKRIAFSEEAIVYDEKTSRPDQLVNQRSRWINTWFKYFSFGFGLTARGIKNYSINQLLFGLVLLRPPLFIFLLLSAGCLGINICFNVFGALLWLMGFLVFATGFLIALIHSDTDKKIYKSLIGIPVFVFLQVVSLLNVRKANKRSVATKHYHSATIDKLN